MTDSESPCELNDAAGHQRISWNFEPDYKVVVNRTLECAQQEYPGTNAWKKKISIFTVRLVENSVACQSRAEIGRKSSTIFEEKCCGWVHSTLLKWLRSLNIRKTFTCHERENHWVCLPQFRTSRLLPRLQAFIKFACYEVICWSMS